MLIALDNLRSAHNVGSILRTCDALGIKEIHLCGITPGLQDKGVLKTSLGAELNLNITEIPDLYHDLTKLKADGYTVIGLEISDQAIDISNYVAPEKAVLVVGNEVSGLGDEVQQICDTIVQIPMRGVKESLNVSVAFGIAAYELINNTTRP